VLDLDAVRRLQAGWLTFDYYPSGEPLLLDAELERLMHDLLAQGLPAGAVMNRLGLAATERLAREPAAVERARAFWRRAGVRCVAVTLGGLDARLGEHEAVYRSIARWMRRFEVAPYMTLCRSPRDVEAAHAADKVGVVFALQNTTAVTDLDMPEVLAALGVRIVQLTYNDRNLVGDGCTEPDPGGLSVFGRAVVDELDRLGLVIDLSHVSERTGLDAMARSRRPVAVTHSCCKALHGHDRAKTDGFLRELRDHDGYFGVVAVPFFLSDKPAPTLEDMVDHVAHAAEIMGVERVGIGTDWGAWTPDLPPALQRGVREEFMRRGFRPEHGLRMGVPLGELGDYGDWPLITRALLRRGFTETETAGIVGGNFLRFWRRVLG
jgi:membrane dipeptidase